MFKHVLRLAVVVGTLCWFGCGGEDDPEDQSERSGPGDGAGAGAGQGPSDPAPQFPSAEDISAALADAGVFFDEGGVTIGDSRIDLGPDGIRLDDASVVSINDGSIVLGAGDGAIAIRTDGTCAELLACCESLTEEAMKTECTTAHNDLMGIPFGGGDFLCGQFVASYCP